MVDTLAHSGDEGRSYRRYATGSWKHTLIRGFPNGATPSTTTWIHRVERANPANWNILVAGGRENKSDSLSSGERNGNSLNQSVYWLGSWDSDIESVGLDEVFERHTRGGESPVVENPRIVAESRVAWGTRNPVWISEDHLVRLNTSVWPIVNQYREGKVKRTPEGEWNRTWNH